MTRHEIALYVTAIRAAVIDLCGGAVDPVQAFFFDVLERSFAEVIVRID